MRFLLLAALGLAAFAPTSALACAMRHEKVRTLADAMQDIDAAALPAAPAVAAPAVVPAAEPAVVKPTRAAIPMAAPTTIPEAAPVPAS